MQVVADTNGTGGTDNGAHLAGGGIGSRPGEQLRQQDVSGAAFSSSCVRKKPRFNSQWHTWLLAGASAAAQGNITDSRSSSSASSAPAAGGGDARAGGGRAEAASVGCPWVSLPSACS